MLLSAEHINKNYGTRQLLDDATLYMPEGSKLGFIGVNGTGKSTFMKILAGEERTDSGTIALGNGVRLSYLPQTPVMNDSLTVLDQVFDALPGRQSDIEQFREQHEFEAKSILTRLNIADFSAKVGTLSGGQRKRVALASAFVKPAEILLLDEPTNHLDSEMVVWLEKQLVRLNAGIIMITHDRYFLENVVNGIVELSHGKLYSYEANYSKYLELKAQRLEMDDASERKRQALLRKESEWIMRGARARTTKSTERIARYDSLKSQAAPEKQANIEISGAASRLGRKTIELDHIAKTYDGRTVISDFSYTVLRDDRIGVVGHNGVGKSTLLNIIAGRIQPDTGTVDAGATVRLGYFMQENKELELDKRVYETITEVASEVRTLNGTLTASQMLELFLFTPDMQYTNVGRLSGGERRRLYLLSILMAAPNILLLDEPTNDLDIETLTILEDYITTFPGAIIAVSHDRYFLDKVATSIFEVGEDGAVSRFMGAYSDYAAAISQRRREAVPEVKQPGATKQVQIKATPTKLKFTFREQREFETIDDAVAEAERQFAECEAEIERCSTDYARLQELMVQREQLQSNVDEKTERWIYLNDLYERIQAQDVR